jgi:chromosome segregation ATPase
LNFQVERMVRRNLEAEIQTLQEELRRQKDSLESAVAQLESLRAMQSTKDMVCDTSSA